MKQETALALMEQGHNIFLTGEAGSGKTYTIQRFITHLLNKKIKVAITASTGIAASHFGGVTIHSWSGMGIKTDMDDTAIERVLERRGMRDKLRDCSVLVIDEVSMLSPEQISLVDKILKKARKNTLPFGGMQVILCGDFFQLPPVSPDFRSDSVESAEKKKKYCFQAPVWVNAEFKVCYLTEQHRAQDGVLTSILNAIREDNLTSEHLATLNATKAKKSSLNATRLYTHNANVNSINNKLLADLKGDQVTYEHTIVGSSIKAMEYLMTSVLAESTLNLKVGAKVMFVKNNFDSGYVNGTQGTITGFSKVKQGVSLPIVTTTDGAVITAEVASWTVEENGMVVACYEQVPLRLAWAITIHKSQGMSLDEAEIDLSRTFTDGQGYVALSRLKHIDGLQLSGFNPNALRLDSLSRKADARFKELSSELEAMYFATTTEKTSA